MIFKVGEKTESSHASIYKGALRDKRMSISARGVLCYLLSFSENWEANLDNICNYTTSGRKSVRSAMRELRRLGYAKLRAIPDPKQSGQWLGRRYVVFDCPKSRGPTLPKAEGPEMGVFTRGSRHHPKGEVSTTKNREHATRPSGRGGVCDSPSFGVDSRSNGKEVQLVECFIELTIKKRLFRGMPGSTRNGWTPRTICNWTRSCRELLEQEEYTKVKTVLLWYSSHYGEEFVPQCRTMRKFCARFQDIEDAMKRRRKGNGSDEEEFVVKGRDIYED